MKPKNLSFLDSLRLTKGADSLRYLFRDLAARDRQKAVHHLNDENLQFPTLFVLAEDIKNLSLFNELSPRNIVALWAYSKRAGNFDLSFRLESLLPGDREVIKASLGWMLKTGLYWDCPQKLCDSFDAALDAAVALLIRTYKDMSVLPDVAKLIFRRNRKGLNIHDLVWSFFESYNRDSLKILAEYLLSENPRDFKLACHLLHISVPQGAITAAVKKRMYLNFISWHRENSPYTIFTGEHFQQTSEPNPYSVDDEAKYLGKRISPKNGRPLEPLSMEEEANLEMFRQAPEKDRKALAEYSAKMQARDARSWSRWMKGSLSEQVSAAVSESQVYL